MIEVQKIFTSKPDFSEHSKTGAILILFNIIWWISANFTSQKFKLFLGISTFILALLTSYTSFKHYKSKFQKKTSEVSLIGLIWAITITIFVENCFFDFQSPQILILSVIFGGMAIVALIIDIFIQPSFYKILLQYWQDSGNKWSIKIVGLTCIQTSIMQVIALYTLVRYPFLDQLSWKDYPDQYKFLVNGWHFNLNALLFMLPVYSLFSLNKISEKFVYLFLIFIGFLSILFCVSGFYLKVKWFF